MVTFERREISSLERCRLDKLITLALTNFPSYLLLRIVALLSWTSLSEKSSLELSLILLEVDKLGLSLIIISEFVEILDLLLTLTEEGANVNKLTKFKISDEKLSRKFFRSIEKVHKLECSKNLSSTSCLNVSLIQSFLSFFLFLLILRLISLSKCTTSLTNQSFKSSDCCYFYK